MTKKVMDVKASDNIYLHRDFHGALSTGIEYLEKTYGSDAVLGYLRQFTLDFYCTLIEDIETRGLAALKEHYEKIYDIEGMVYSTDFTDESLTFTVTDGTPVQHMRQNNYKVANMFVETIKTVNETLCEGSPYKAELIEYNEEDGTYTVRFSKR